MRPTALKEEKERGITIELGFASLDLSNGQHIGIVDMPRATKNLSKTWWQALQVLMWW